MVKVLIVGGMVSITPVLLKVAVPVVLAVRLKVQVLLLVQPAIPVHEVKVACVAVRVTWVLYGKLVVQVVEQLVIPAGVEVIVPVWVPALVMVRVGLVVKV